ncbi:MAG: hypothetical protein ACRC6T_05070 [Sarcina sp.]
MSKKKHREKRKNENENIAGMNPQIMDMLRGSNIDMNKVSAIMGAMNQNGFDINSLAGLLQNNGGMNLPNMNNSQMDLGNISSMLKNMDMHNNNFTSNNESNNASVNFSANNYSVYDTDENIEMLLTIKSVVNPKKARFLEKVIEMYKNGEINY